VNSRMQFLSPSKAASRLGVSVKALRIYEQRGLMTPTRTEAGWRAYGPAEMQRAGEIVALRALGLSLAQVGSVLKGEAEGLEPALALHQAVLEGDARRLELTPFRGHLMVLTEGVRRVQTAHPQAALSGAIS
jgi:DNA-binding transcriptional MerR regulator